MEQQKVVYPDGNRYFGQVDEQGLPHGNGTMVYKQKPYVSWMEFQVAFKEYKGQWLHGKRSGSGRMKYYQNGSGTTVYSGSWKEDLPDGTGTFEHYGSVVDVVYRGDWREGLRHGQGTYRQRWDKGTFPVQEYTGHWENDKRSGWGVESVGVDQYEGEWSEDLRQGKGKWTYENGDTFEGTLQAGNRHGEGTYRFAQGGGFVAIWNQDRLDMTTVRLLENATGPIVLLKVLSRGFDYHREAESMLIARKGVIRLEDTAILSQSRSRGGFRSDELLLEITEFDRQCVHILVPDSYTNNKGPQAACVAVGQKQEFGYRWECTATIYDEDYDYVIENTLIVECY